MKLKMGNGAILAYRRLPYRPWYALAEYVDNSTDSYARPSNSDRLQKQLDADSEVLTVEIEYSRDNSFIRITDNAMGMSESELDQALVIGDEPQETAGRSEFGMGMKVASIWFADTFEIRTKKLGEDHEVKVTISIPEFVQGNEESKSTLTKKDKKEHYTLIELRDLKRKLTKTTLNKTSEFLGSIYRNDIRSGRLNLILNGETIKAPTSKDDDAFVRRSDDTKVVVPITNLEVNGKIVNGWVGVLKPGYTGRSVAGFALIRHGRAVKGWLDSWRPYEIFGDARNDKLNQRIAGELVMDAFTASHTKDAIDWESDDETVLGELLLELCKEYDIIRIAKQKTTGTEDPESEIEKNEAQAQLSAQFGSAKVTDVIRMLDVPKPELAKFASSVLIQAAEDRYPVCSFEIDAEGRRAHLFEVPLSINDPYYEYEVLESKDLRVVINSAHPAYDLLDSAEARAAHYHHVLLDAISEWKCTQVHAPLEPSSVRLMKEKLFRVISEVATEID